MVSVFGKLISQALPCHEVSFIDYRRLRVWLSFLNEGSRPALASYNLFVGTDVLLKPKPLQG